MSFMYPEGFNDHDIDEPGDMTVYKTLHFVCAAGIKSVRITSSPDPWYPEENALYAYSTPTGHYPMCGQFRFLKLETSEIVNQLILFGFNEIVDPDPHEYSGTLYGKQEDK